MEQEEETIATQKEAATWTRLRVASKAYPDTRLTRRLDKLSGMYMASSAGNNIIQNANFKEGISLKRIKPIIHCKISTHNNIITLKGEVEISDKPIKYALKVLEENSRDKSLHKTYRYCISIIAIFFLMVRWTCKY